MFALGFGDLEARDRNGVAFVPDLFRITNVGRCISQFDRDRW